LQYAGVYALNAHGAAQRAAEGWLFSMSIRTTSCPRIPPAASAKLSAIAHRSGEIVFPEYVPARLAALDYLLTRADWDGKTIVLTGGSMGGQQSLVLAACVPRRFTAVLVCVPAGADTNGDLQRP